MPNRLIHARSPYLKKAAEQPVDWYEWGEEAFEKAKAEDKPIFLSIGGVWCHWCHVMAHETFEDKGVAQLINENFVPVKVDRDERPDIDRRYQDVVLRISGSGGWPLTAFLTAEGRVFFGGTYFPPEDTGGRVGLKTILQKLLELYHRERSRIETVAEELYQQSLSAASSSMAATPDRDLVEKALSAFLSSVDFQNGGMGRAPKFHHASALEFLLSHGHFKKNELVTRAIEISLDAMARGGVYDHLLGGFFRYSTDEKWIVPHFEKMLHDNAELLRLYSISHRVFRKDLYRYVAEGIVDYYRKYGFDERGGFYASQDADIGVLDEGGYYCFSLPETRALLTEDEFNVISLHYDIMPEGEMHHDPSKNVLFIAKEAEGIAEILGMPLGSVEGLIRSARGKLLAYREGEREMPYVDKTVYANWNGLMIEAMCVAGNLLDKKEYLEMAERAAKRIIADFYREGRLQHREGVDGFSEDYLFFSKGLLALHEATQDRKYLATAKNLMDTAIELFWDKTNWGFFDNAGAGPGYLTITVKNIQDTTGQSANGAAPYVLQLLAMLTRDTTYTKYAERTLNAFASLMAEYPTASASYFLSLAAFERGIYLVETSAFFEEALRDFRPYKFVVRSDIEGVMVCEKDRCNVYKKYVPAS